MIFFFLETGMHATMSVSPSVPSLFLPLPRRSYLSSRELLQNTPASAYLRPGLVPKSLSPSQPLPAASSLSLPPRLLVCLSSNVAYLTHFVIPHRTHARGSSTDVRYDMFQVVAAQRDSTRRRVPEEAKWENVPKKGVRARFDNAALTLELGAGAGGVDCIVTGWKAPIRAHDAAAQRVEVEMKNVELARCEFQAKHKVHANWDTAWLLLNDRPEELDEYLSLRPKMDNFAERLMLIKKTDEKVAAEDEWRRFHELKGKCERLLEAREALGVVQRAKEDAFQRMKEADQILEEAVATETELADLVTEDHVYADDEHIPVADVFIGVTYAMRVMDINGMRVAGKQFDDILDVLQRARTPHLVTFERYDYRFNLVTGDWEPLETLRAQGKYVEDPRVAFEVYLDMCRKGDLVGVELSLKQGIDVDTRDATRSTGLHYAAANGQVHIIDALVEAGATIEIKDANRLTPMLTACRKGDVSAFEALRRRGARIDIRDNHGRTAVILAVQSGSHDMVQRVCDVLVDIHAPDKTKGWTPLHYAASLGYPAVVALLLDRGASPYARAARDDDVEPLSLCRRLTDVYRLVDERIRSDPAQCVLDRGPTTAEVWLGSRHAAYRHFALERNFDAVLSVFDRGTKDIRLQWLTDSRIEHHALVANLSDIDDPDNNNLTWQALLAQLHPALGFLYSAVKRKRTVLVHCDLGVCPSFAVMLAYMVTKRGVRLDDAVSRFAQIRHELQLSPAVKAGLEDLQAALDKRKLERLDHRLKHSPLMMLHV